MSSDDAYSSFLDQANQDTGVSSTPAQAETAHTKAVDVEVPRVLSEIQQDYVSESDEPFEPVSLAWDGRNMPSEDEFKELIGHQAEVSTLSVKEFDPRDHYRSVLQAVEKAGDGKVRVYRVEHGRTRMEYYVVGLDTEGKRVVGLKAKAVES
ncbi:hypothetical protein MMC14_007435 [Varicellaria rhodocarpa]|nr:hypothetical protein [Varicellaria rhodocarpa]